MADTSVTFTATTQRWSTKTNNGGAVNGVKRPNWNDPEQRIMGGGMTVRVKSGTPGTLGGTVVELQRRKSEDSTMDRVTVITEPEEVDLVGLNMGFVYDILCTTYGADVTVDLI
jgi:hypothetical protein